MISLSLYLLNPTEKKKRKEKYIFCLALFQVVEVVLDIVWKLSALRPKYFESYLKSLFLPSCDRKSST